VIYAKHNTRATDNKLAPKPATFLMEAPVGVAAVAVPVDVTVAAGGAVACALTPPVTAPLSVSVTSLLPIARAACLKASYVLPDDGALMEPTMPFPQCVTCLQ